MSFVAKLFGGTSRRDRRAQAFSEEFWATLGLTTTYSGVTVSMKTALQTMAVLACVKVLAEGVAQVPLRVFKRRKPRADGNAAGADPALGHPLYRLLYRKPNPWQTSFEFREMLMVHAALAGRFICFKNVVNGKVIELMPLEEGEVSVERDDFRRLWYTVTAPNGKVQVFPQEAIWHVKGLSLNGWDGLVPLKLAREAIGLSMATEKAHALMHANGAQPGGLYSIDGTLGKDQYAVLRNWITQNLAGENRFKPMILDRGAKFIQTSMTGVDAQHLETRRFQIEEVARAFRVFPQMIGYTDKTATFASAEAFFVAHVVHTLMPWFERLEQSIDCNVLTDADDADGYYAKFQPNGLMRGNSTDRASFYRSLWEMGAISPNEIRALEEMNPYEGGDTFRVQLNLTDASKPTPDPVAPGAGAGQDDNEPPEKKPAQQQRRQNKGRVLSGHNEALLRSAKGNLEEVLAAVESQEQE